MTAPAPASNSTAVATRSEEPKGLVGLFQSAKARAQIEPFLHGVAIERVVQEVILAANENPKIKTCTPQSIVSAVARAVSWGGIIGEEVHLVPFGVNVAERGQPDQWEDRLKPMMDYKFKAKLIVATGTARRVYAVAVYKNEPFRLMQGTSTRVEHQVILDPKERGPMIGAYAVAILRHGEAQVVSKTIDEIDAVRKKSSKQWKNGECPEWYALKTVIHNLAKLLPASPKMAELLKKFGEEEADEIEALPDTGPVADVEAPATVRHLSARGVDVGHGQLVDAYVGDMPRGVVPGQAADADPIYEQRAETEDERQLRLDDERFDREGGA